MEILATIPVYSHPFFCDMFLAATIIMIMAGLSIGIIVAAEIKSWTICIIGLLFLVIGTVGVKHSLELRNRLETFKYNKYKVIIDETLNAKEFLNQYEILSREGEIFTIREIEVDE